MNSAARQLSSSLEPDQPYWPHDTSREPVYTIGKVLDVLCGEFPSLNAPKLRMLEKFGIVMPARMANGYRGYSQADLERLRYALRIQRDSFLPLENIGENLAILDRGGEPPAVEPVARVVASHGVLEELPPTSRLTVRQLMDYTGVDAEDLDAMVKAKLISPDLSGRFPYPAIHVVAAVTQLQAAGIGLRNLRPARSAANSALDLIEAATFSGRHKSNAAAKERARAQAYDLAKGLSTLVEALISQGVEEIT